MAGQEQDFLPISVAEGRVRPGTPEQIKLLKMFNTLRPDQRIDLRQRFQAHKAIPGAAIRNMLGITSLRDTTESDIA